MLTMLAKRPPAADAVRVCRQCGARCGTLATHRPSGLPDLVWAPCEACLAESRAAAARLATDRVGYQQQQQLRAAAAAAQDRPDVALDRFVAQGMTEAAWERRRASAAMCIQMARNWWHAVAAGVPDPGPRPMDSWPSPALYISSPTRGNGKTHLAAVIGMWAAAAGWPVTILEMRPLCAWVWAQPLDRATPALLRYASMPGVLILDDLGRQSEGRGVRGIIDTLIGERYACGGWTVITSNIALTDLLDRGVVNESTFSRLGAMAQTHITPTAPDYRMEARYVPVD